MSVESGGSSTINGVLYQMLWSLLSATEIYAESDAEGEAATNAFLIVEPSEGGGDLRRHEVAGRRVQQIKARTNDHPWSLTELIKEVLPDLYKAVDVGRADDVYEFVTEGRRGDWEQVEAFFQELKICSLETLDAVTPLRFRHTVSADSFFTQHAYTKKTLFDRITDHLKLEGEDQSEAEIKVWHLLSHLDCRWCQTPEVLEERVDRFLLEVVDYAESVMQKRMLLIATLAHKATVAGTNINAAELFAECGLSGRRLSQWQSYLRRGASIVFREAELRDYNATDDVRPRNTPLPQEPIIVLSGESGSGKSWHLLSTALFLSLTGLVTFFSASGVASSDLQRAAAIFWEDIGDHDQPLSLPRIAKRLRDVGAVTAGQWLHLCIDNLQNLEEAKELTVQDWEGLGTRLVVTAPPHIARLIEETALQRVQVINVGDFSEQEMRTYLTGSDRVRWQSIPADIRDTFRRPLLARLYRRIASNSTWSAPNEYMLYDRWWSDLREGRELISAGLVRLALSKWHGRAYPWTAQQLANAGLDQNATDDLVQHGGLQRTVEGAFMIWHDRLLNWLVAEGLLEEYVSGALSQEALCAEIAKLFWQVQAEGNFFGYVAMDIVWMLITRRSMDADTIDAVLDALADGRNGDWRGIEILFEHQLPTVGSPVASALVRYLLRHHDKSHFKETNALVAGLVKLNAEDTSAEVAHLLSRPELAAVRAAVKLLSKKPHQFHLKELWRLYCSMSLHPERFVKAGEKESDVWWLRHSTYKALQACVKLDPSWLETAIFRADPAQEPVHDLAYLLASLTGERERWLRCKATLKAKINPAKERAIASNIYTHRDEIEKEWLQARIDIEEDSLGVYALHALARIDVESAVLTLSSLDGASLYLTRSWCLRGLLLRRPADVHAQLWIRLSSDPVSVIRSFQGLEDHLTAEMVNWLLDRAEEALENSGDLEDAWLSLETLAQVNRLTHLHCFEKRQGTSLETLLLDLLARSPRPYVAQETAVREPALAVLYKIGGAGVTGVTNAWLAAAHRFSKFDAMKIAFKRPDAETIRILGTLISSKKPGTAEDESISDGVVYQAVETLAKMQQWHLISDFITRNGMRATPRYVSEVIHGNFCLLDGTLSTALSAFAESHGIHEGAILALGIGGRSDYLDRIVEVAELVPAESDIADAATVALTFLDDSEGQATEMLAKRLLNGQSVFAAVNALLRNPNPRALSALVKHLRSHPSAELAVVLLRFPETREMAISIMQENLKTYRFGEQTFRLLERSDDRHAIRELITPELRQWIEDQAFALEGGIWNTGSKAAYIYALSAVDKERAFEAALSTLQNPDSHDHEYYPYRLITIDKARALDALFDLAEGQRSSSLVASIGRALGEIPDEAQPAIEKELQSIHEQRRVAACWLAAYQPFSQKLMTAVRACLEDPWSEVVHAAEEALWRMQNNEWCEELMNAFALEVSPERKWRLLDSALAIGDPGDSHHYWPQWLGKSSGSLSHVWQTHIADALKKRQEGVLKKLQDADKQNE